MNSPLPIIPDSTDQADSESELTAPACVMYFNCSEPTGGAGIAADLSTCLSMGAHPLPILTSVLLRDSAQVFGSVEIDPETVADQARGVLEDIRIAGWKVGYLGSAEGISAIAEILTDYGDVPLVAYMGHLNWLEEDPLQQYYDAYRELVLPQATILIGSHKVLCDFLLPDWEEQRSPSPRELAVAAESHGVEYLLVTSLTHPGLGGDSSIENVLATAQGVIFTDKSPRHDGNYYGAGETLSAAIAALLSSGADMSVAIAEGLNFMHQAVQEGFSLGMGASIPDRLFWAMPSEEDGDDALVATPSTSANTTDEPELIVSNAAPVFPRKMH